MVNGGGEQPRASSVQSGRTLGFLVGFDFDGSQIELFTLNHERRVAAALRAEQGVHPGGGVTTILALQFYRNAAKPQPRAPRAMVFSLMMSR